MPSLVGSEMCIRDSSSSISTISTRLKRDVPGTSRPSFVSSVRRRSGSGGLVSLVRPRRVATRETSGKRFQKSLESRSDSCLSNRFSRSNASSLDRPWRRENTSGKMVGPHSPRHPASRQTNHDETTVFPRPQRETRERYAPVSYTHLRAHETRHDLVCRLLLE